MRRHRCAGLNLDDPPARSRRENGPGRRDSGDGDVDYTYEIVPTEFAEDRWVQTVEVLPSLRTNVHHAVVYVRPPGSSWLKHAPVGVPFTAEDLSDPEDRRGAHWTDADVLLVYAPGSSPDEWPATMAKFVPAGSDLVFQMHYTTNGHAGTDADARGHEFREATTTETRVDAATDKRSFRDSAGCAGLSRRGPRNARRTTRCCSVCFRTCICAENEFEYNIVHPSSDARNRNSGAATTDSRRASGRPRRCCA